MGGTVLRKPFDKVNVGRIRSEMKSYARAAGIAGAVVVLCGAACSKSANVSGGAKGAEVAKAAEATPGTEAKGAKPERYPITGVVVSADAAKKVLVVTHDEIPGYMPAMTMEFLVSVGDVAVAKPGQRIRAEMIPSKDGDFRLEKIWPAEKSVVPVNSTLCVIGSAGERFNRERFIFETSFA